MKWLFIGISAGVFLLTAEIATASDQVPITNSTMVITVGDSFYRSQYGQRFNFVIGSYFLNYYSSSNMIQWRDHSRSGASDFGFVTDQIPKYCIPDVWSTQNKTNVLLIIHSSGNGGFNSNLVFTNITIGLSFPTTNYSQNNVFTNDGFPALIKFAVIGDTPYYASAGGSSYAYSGGGRVAAQNGGYPYVDTWNNLTNYTFNYNGGYPANSNLWFPNGGAYDHNANALQGAWAFTTLTNWQVDSNAFTLIADWTSSVGWTTNHCIAKSISTGSSLSFTFHADRMGPSFYVPDGTTTNDMRDAFTGIPSLGLTFHEDLRVLNLPLGIYNVTMGSHTFTASSAQLSAGYNLWTNYNTPLFDKKMAVLYSMCDMMDVLHTDSSTAAHGGAGLLIPLYESNARGEWPGNPIGTALYATNSTMVSQEALLQAQDAVMHTTAQQSDISVTITAAAGYAPAPFR